MTRILRSKSEKTQRSEAIEFSRIPFWYTGVHILAHFLWIRYMFTYSTVMFVTMSLLQFVVVTTAQAALQMMSEEDAEIIFPSFYINHMFISVSLSILFMISWIGLCSMYWQCHVGTLIFIFVGLLVGLLYGLYVSNSLRYCFLHKDGFAWVTILGYIGFLNSPQGFSNLSVSLRMILTKQAFKENDYFDYESTFINFYCTELLVNIKYPTFISLATKKPSASPRRRRDSIPYYQVNPTMVLMLYSKTEKNLISKRYFLDKPSSSVQQAIRQQIPKISTYTILKRHYIACLYVQHPISKSWWEYYINDENTLEFLKLLLAEDHKAYHVIYHKKLVELVDAWVLIPGNWSQIGNFYLKNASASMRDEANTCWTVPQTIWLPPKQLVSLKAYYAGIQREKEDSYGHKNGLWRQWNDPVAVCYQHKFTSWVQKSINNESICSSNALSLIYNHQSSIVTHTDKDLYYYSVSLCVSSVGQTQPLYILARDRLGIYKVSLREGQSIFFRGFLCPHWRPYGDHGVLTSISMAWLQPLPSS
mmetsp:Transcript_9173/g.13572  ORF Transcript_9173/g.13572 Transcript_9173/m.13572 type:complete len:533 (-) Transcript_9173:1541-3139(-)